MAVFYRYDYTEITKNIHPCLDGNLFSQTCFCGVHFKFIWKWGDTCLYSDLHGRLGGGGLEPVPPRGATNQHFRSKSTLKTTTDVDHAHVHFTKNAVAYLLKPPRHASRKSIIKLIALTLN